MADIFISYAKADRDAVALLSAFFEAHGYKCWWDTRLNAGDDFRQEIAEQIDRSRALVVLWTPHSIHSQFVRAEASRGKRQGKLIPIKAETIGYDDIPLPFGEFHTEDITQKDAVLDLVNEKINAPVESASTLHLAIRTMRYQVLSWFGLIGGAITIFSNARGFITMVNVIKLIVDQWHNWMQSFWDHVLAIIGVKPPPFLAPILSFLAFSCLVILNARFQRFERSWKKYRSMTSAERGQFFRDLARLVASRLALVVAVVACFGLIAMCFMAFDMRIVAMALLYICPLFVIMAVLYSSKARIRRVVFIALLAPIFVIMFAGPFCRSNVCGVANTQLTSWSNHEVFALAVTVFVMVFTLAPLVAPIPVLNAKLARTLGGVLILMGLNEIGKRAIEIQRWLAM